MKIGQLLFLCWLFIAQLQGKLLKHRSRRSNSKQRELGWITDTLSSKNVAWGTLAGVPALAGGFYATMPNRTELLGKAKAGRRLKYEQTIYETRHSTNKQMTSELEEIMHRGDMMLREFQKEALNRINGLRSDIQLKFKDYGTSENNKNQLHK